MISAMDIRCCCQRSFLKENCPTEKSYAAIHRSRAENAKILDADDPRLLVVVGPCSIHDTRAAREYAILLKGTIKELGRELRLVDAPVF